jgi:hypothetical protein
VGVREVLGRYLSSASKNTPETDIFLHGTNSLLTSVICGFKNSHKILGIVHFHENFISSQ